MRFAGASGALRPRVHRGFLSSLLKSGLLARVLVALEATRHADAAARGADEARVLFVGHSLGGALAALAAPIARVHLALRGRVELWTFGCPRVGNLVRASP